VRKRTPEELEALSARSATLVLEAWLSGHAPQRIREHFAVMEKRLALLENRMRGEM
jgi:hypothetical protein